MRLPRRRTLAGLALLAVLVGGALASAQVGDEPIVATQTFTHEDVVTYTVPTRTVVSTQTETVVSTVTETVVSTVTGPGTTTGPPPPPETVDCRVSNFRDWQLGGDECRFETLVEIVDAQVRCNEPLVEEYGPLPVRIEHTFTRNPDYGDQGGWDAENGCRGDGDPDTVDVIYRSNADGFGLGTCGGGGKFRALPGPRDIQITGNFDGGRVCGGAHQDGLQFQQERLDANIDLVNATSGDCDAGTSTVVGAGGSVFLSSLYDVDVWGGCFVSCNHGMFGHVSGVNAVMEATFRTGRTDGSDPKCVGVFAGNPCQAGAVYHNVTCERWNATLDRWEPRPP